jgi:hypothetical protein
MKRRGLKFDLNSTLLRLYVNNKVINNKSMTSRGPLFEAFYKVKQSHEL